MAYKKRTMKPKKRAYRKSRMPFSKKQAKAIKSLALKTTNKTRELKNVNVNVNEYNVSLGGAAMIRNDLGNDYIYNYVAQGDGHYNRDGNQIQPIGLSLRGWTKINGSFTNASYREIALRVVAAYVSDDTLNELETGFNSTQVFWSNQSVIPTGDYRDILRKFNYSKIQPIYDRTFKVAPSPQFSDGASSVVQTTPAVGVKDYAMININHKFSKNSELTWSHQYGDCWQKKNLVLFAVSRLMNDDTDITTVTHEFCLEGNFYYHDA